MRAPDYERGGVRLWCGDCKEMLTEMPTDSVDCVVTDPPWELSKGRIEIGGAGVAPIRQKSFTLEQGRVGVWDEVVIRECQRIAAGDCFFFAGYKELGKLCLACNPLRGVFAWHKPNGTPAVFYPAKLDLSFIVWGGKKSTLYGFQHWPSMVFSYPFPPAGCFASERIVDETGKAVHPCQGPLALYVAIIKPMPTTAILLEPYLGSGTTAVACVKTGRRCLGIELDQRYFDIACRRVEEAYEDTALLDESGATGEQLAL